MSFILVVWETWFDARTLCFESCCSKDIGEEFVEFLERELNITDSEVEANQYGDGSQKGSGTKGTQNASENEAGKGSSIEENIDEIEATLARLKKELGL